MDQQQVWLPWVEYPDNAAPGHAVFGRLAREDEKEGEFTWDIIEIVQVRVIYWRVCAAIVVPHGIS